MSETKFKRVISLANATLLNMTRDAMDGEITNEEFVNIMFVLGSYEEAGWIYDGLKNKAKNLIPTLSPYAKNLLDKAVAEGSDMYEKCERMRKNQNKNRGKGKTDTPTTNGKKEENDDRPIYKVIGSKILLMPRGREELREFGIDELEMQEFLNKNFTYYKNDSGAFDDMFTTEELVQDFREHQDNVNKSYPAAPPRGK